MQDYSGKASVNRIFILLFFSGVLICHFFVFIEYRTVSNEIFSFSGVDLIFNTQRHLIPTLYQPHIWGIATLSAGLGGFSMYLFSEKERGYGFLFGLAGLIGLMLTQTSLSVIKMPGDATPLYVDFGWAYWVSALLFVLAACKSFIYQAGQRLPQAQEPRQLHINIISSSEEQKNNRT